MATGCVNRRKVWALLNNNFVGIRAVRRRRRSADILLTPLPPIITDRCAAAAAE